MTELAAWVGVFPRVRHVDVAFDPESQGFHADLAIFLGAVKVTAVLNKINVNGRVYDLPHAGMAPTLT
jgi:alpha-D-ribose 1-methylphosphonate 5-triphosphate synthase subunit PhnL